MLSISTVCNTDTRNNHTKACAASNHTGVPYPIKESGAAGAGATIVLSGPNANPSPRHVTLTPLLGLRCTRRTLRGRT